MAEGHREGKPLSSCYPGKREGKRKKKEEKGGWEQEVTVPGHAPSDLPLPICLQIPTPPFSYQWKIINEVRALMIRSLPKSRTSEHCSIGSQAFSI